MKSIFEFVQNTVSFVVELVAYLSAWTIGMSVFTIFLCILTSPPFIFYAIPIIFVLFLIPGEPEKKHEQLFIKKSKKKKKKSESTAVVGKHYSPPDRAEFEAANKVINEKAISKPVPSFEDELAAKETEKKARADAVDAMIKANRLKAIENEKLKKSQKGDLDGKSFEINNKSDDESNFNKPLADSKTDSLKRSVFNDAVRDYESAVELGNNTELKTCLNWILKAGEIGLPEAELYLGDLFFHGYGLEKNYEQALKWYYKASDHGVTARALRDNINYIKASLSNKLESSIAQDQLCDQGSKNAVPAVSLGKLLSEKFKKLEAEKSIVESISTETKVIDASNKNKSEPSYESVLKKRLKSRGYKFKSNYATSPDGKVTYIASVFQLLDLLEQSDAP